VLAVAAISGAIADPIAEQWGRAHPILLALGCAAIPSALLASFVVEFRLLGWQKQDGISPACGCSMAKRAPESQA